MTHEQNATTASSFSGAPRRRARSLPPLAALALLAAAAGGAAQAQPAPPLDQGYVGVHVGRSDYALSCGTAGGCDRQDTSYKLTFGRYFSPHFGAELGLMDLGKVSRGGAEAQASGLNLSLVGRLPMDRFTLYGKLGAVYAETRADGAALATGASGRATGWGPSVALGASYDLGQRTAVVLEWERNRMNFAGGEGRQDVDNASVGLRYRF